MAKLTPSFILTAQGHLMMPKLDIAVWGDGDEESAIREAKGMVSQLSKAGYFSFWLVTNEDTNVVVTRFRVEEQAPIVTECK